MIQAGLDQVFIVELLPGCGLYLTYGVVNVLDYDRHISSDLNLSTGSDIEFPHSKFFVAKCGALLTINLDNWGLIPCIDGFVRFGLN